MDMEPDHLVEDNTYSGKRKRSSNTGSTSPSSSAPGGLNESISNNVRKDGPHTTLKRARVGSPTPDPAHESDKPTFAVCARAFPLPPFPVEIVQHILSYLDPFSLGRLMSVNNYLRGLLDSHNEPARSLGFKTHLPILTSEHIWSCSRKAHRPGMPHPLQSVSELEMFRLIYGQRCQICSMLPQTQSSKIPISPWNSGPGPTGVRTVWPFKVKTCGDCLKLRLLKDTDLPELAGFELQKGLLPALFTPSVNYVMSITVTQVPVPPGLKLERCFYQPHVQDLLRRSPDPQDPAYRPWLQQLDALRQEAMTDIVRLEAWEASQKVQHDLLAVPSNLNSRSSASGSSVHSDNLTRSYFTTSTGGGRPALSSRTGPGTSSVSGSLMRHSMAPQMSSQRPGLAQSTQSFTPMPGALQVFPPLNAVTGNYYRPAERSSLDIMRLRAEKRAEIERRCRENDPPIQPSVLDQCPAFVSALQVLMPLDEALWQKLRLQLLDQRHAVEMSGPNEHDTTQYVDAMDTASIRRAATPLAETPEVDLLKEAFRPVRDKLYDFAREYVHRHYANGTGLTYSSAPQFAADVLIYVRQRFYENLDQEDEAFRADGQQPLEENASGTRARILRLEHMRWVFESSIKPYTEFVRKELFLCRACDTQGRHFAFEAIIQHFASKHTDDFSRGNAVVYWKAEWPLQPPFESKPAKDLDPSTNISHTQSISRFPPTMGVVQQTDFLPPAHDRDNHENQVPDRSNQLMSHSQGDRDSQAVTSYPEAPHSRHFVPSNPDQPASMYYRRPPYGSAEAMFLTQHNHHGRPVYSTMYRPHEIEYRERSLENQARFDAHEVGYRTFSASESDFAPSYHGNGGRPSLPFEDWRHRPSAVHHYENSSDTVTEAINATDGTRVNRPSSHNDYRPTETATRMLDDNRGSQARTSASVHRDYDSPSNRSRGSSTTHFRSRVIHERAPPELSELSEPTWRSDADNFLQSLDPEKSRLGSTTASRLSQPPSENQLERDDAFGDRRSNISHPRRRFQDSSDFYRDQSPVNMIYSPEQRTHWDRENQPSTTRPYDTQDNERHPVRYVSHTMLFDPRSQYLNQPEAQRAYADSQRPEYTGQHGRVSEPVDMEARYIEAPRYQELRSGRLHSSGRSSYEDTRLRPSYEREELVWDPRAGRYYVERPVREYISGPRYIAYEELPPREAIHRREAEYYESDGQLPPTSGSYPERHYNS